MKLLIMCSVLIPLFCKRGITECLCILMFIGMPLFWSSWSHLPTSFCIGCMMDELSTILAMLSLWTSILMLLLKPDDKFMKLNILLLLGSLLGFFSTSSFLLFFIMFEASLIPTLFLILGWGYQPERLEASYYFSFYTITFSVPLLASLVWLTSVSGNKYFYFDNMHVLCNSTLGLFILIVFLIKLPMFMTHFWLPKAHVEAPVVGSMILAGVLLKTGGYGIMRVFLYMRKTLVSLSVMTVALIGMVWICLVCLYCIDLKQMIAFSSVSHMNFMIVGLMNNTQATFGGGVVMMVSHGLCSSLMFMLVDLSYKRCNSRSILMSKGFLMVFPPLALFWGLCMMFNMGVPPSASSISELLIISSSYKWLLHSVFFGMYLFLSAFYSMYLYICINHGNSEQCTFSVEVKEAFLTMLHVVPLAGLTLIMKLML